MFQAHPVTTARLLSKIPRLEIVSDIILRQQRGTPPRTRDAASMGAQLLHLALEFDRRGFRGVSPNSALSELRLSGRFDGGMLDALAGYVPTEGEVEFRRMPIRELRAGMVLETDVKSRDGNVLILKRGTVLTETWLERLKNFSKARGTQEFVDIRTSKISGDSKDAKEK